MLENVDRSKKKKEFVSFNYTNNFRRGGEYSKVKLNTILKIFKNIECYKELFLSVHSKFKDNFISVCVISQQCQHVENIKLKKKS